MQSLNGNTNFPIGKNVLQFKKVEWQLFEIKVFNYLLKLFY